MVIVFQSHIIEFTSSWISKVNLLLVKSACNFIRERQSDKYLHILLSMLQTHKVWIFCCSMVMLRELILNFSLAETSSVFGNRRNSSTIFQKYRVTNQCYFKLLSNLCLCLFHVRLMFDGLVHICILPALRLSVV